MASSITLSLPLLLSLTSLLISGTLSQSAPPPSPSGPINITAILAKGSQYNTFIHLLTSTQAADQINGQVNNSQDGMTVFAPTDNAFMNLPAGYMNNLSTEQQVQLVQYHVLPKYYTVSDLLTVPNPVRTQASGQDGKVFGLFFSGEGTQVNVSSGLVVTQVNNALRENKPLAVYQMDKVLLPKELTEAKSPSPSPVTEKTPADSSSGGKAKSEAGSPPSGSTRLDMGFGLVAGIGLFCVGLLL